MKKLFASVTALTLLLAVAAHAESSVISPNGSRPSTIGPAEWFTGSVTVDPYFAPNEQTPTGGGLVTFQPGARSAWHSHPAGQTLIVTGGTGWVQEDGGAKREIKPGDVVWTPPGVKHWHGATDSTGMTHIALTNVLDGKTADWMEKVSDEAYAAD